MGWGALRNMREGWIERIQCRKPMHILKLASPMATGAQGLEGLREVGTALKSHL